MLRWLFANLGDALGGQTRTCEQSAWKKPRDLPAGDGLSEEGFRDIEMKVAVSGAGVGGSISKVELEMDRVLPAAGWGRERRA